MLEQLKQHLPLLQYAHLVGGFALFVGLAVWAYWPSRKRRMQGYAAMILKDDTAPSKNASAARGHHVAKH
jgi:cbb3-type cytochrome oxidase subunit 3